MVFQKNKKNNHVAEQKGEPSELFVSASPNAVDKALKASHDIDEAKLNRTVA